MLCSFLSISGKLSQKNYGELRAHFGSPVRGKSTAAALADARRSSGARTPSKPDGSAPRSAFRAKPPKDEFAFAKNPFAEGAGTRPGHVVPRHILDIAATVTDEVMVPHALCVESRSAPLDRHFTHQTRLHQVPQIVISRGPRTARIGAIHGLEDFRSRRMIGVLQQEGYHGVALRRTPQPPALQGFLDRLGVHEEFRLNLT
jgi:hypothetical protein